MSEPAPPAAVDVLVLVAHRIELAGFGAALGVAAEAGLKPNASSLHGLRVAAAEIGVGMPAAGGGSARALAHVRARAAVLLGSFGAYPGPACLPIGQLLVPNALLAVDVTALQGRAAFPTAMPQRAECDSALAAGLAQSAPDVARGALATTLAITTDDALARELGERSSCCGENLEAVAVALACAAAGLPFAALLACTNQVGSRGRAHWASEHPRAACATANAFLAWLRDGAPGLPER